MAAQRGDKGEDRYPGMPGNSRARLLGVSFLCLVIATWSELGLQMNKNNFLAVNGTPTYISIEEKSGHRFGIVTPTLKPTYPPRNLFMCRFLHQALSDSFLQQVIYVVEKEYELWNQEELGSSLNSAFVILDNYLSSISGTSEMGIMIILLAE